MGQIHQDAFEEEEVLGFVAEAHRFCDLFERLSSLGRLYLLQQLNESLPLLYSMAHRLPDPYNWDEIERDEAWEAEDRRGMPLDEHTAKWSEWSERLRGKLTNHKLFRLVYDPVDPRDREIIECDLAGILTEVYLDMKDGLILFGRGSDEDRAQALWDWRFGLRNNWGRHIAESLTPIHSLIYQHYDEDEGVFDV